VSFSVSNVRNGADPCKVASVCCRSSLLCNITGTSSVLKLGCREHLPSLRLVRCHNPTIFRGPFS
jgi:hypothetical protein